ncbi:MAG TPA: CDC27 family protein [Lacunisphaera sp.]|jgi:Flp pilus assembly protein TadD
MKLPRNKFLSGVALMVGAVVLAGGGYYLLRYQVWAGYRSWSMGHMNGMARDFIAAGDTRNGLLTVRKILSARPNDIAALKLGVKACEMNSSPDALMFQRNLCRIEKTTENAVKMMQLSLKYEAYAYGLEAVTSVAQDARRNPEYHRLAAEIYRRVNRPVPAKYQLISLLSLNPQDNAARMSLAEIEFDSAPKDLPSDWAGRVVALTHVPEEEVAATVLQLRAAVSRKDVKTAGALVEKLQLRSNLTVAQRLSVLEAQWLYSMSDAGSSLAGLQKEIVTNPAEVVQVMDFLTAHEKYEAVRDWYGQISGAMHANEDVKLAAAQSLLALHDWPRLEDTLKGVAWKQNEHIRMALLAYAYRMTGRSADSAEDWKIAMIATGKDPRKIAALLRYVETWRWDDERYDLLWRLFDVMPGNAAVEHFLVAREYHDGKTVNLNKIYAKLVETNPDDDSARNNFAYTSLLLDSNPGRAQTIARELFKKHPENISYRTTYTFALHKQGQDKEALALMRQLDASERLAPVPRLHEAVYAAASGELVQAAALLPELAKAELLPEQRRMVSQVNLLVNREQNVQQRETQLAGAEKSPDTGGWLVLLPKRDREATPSFKIADAYLRNKNFTALRQFLQDERWEQNDYLRFALLALAERSDARGEGPQLYWRQALAAAGHDGEKLNDLEVLTTKWGWLDERMEISARIFERQASDATRLTELLDYYHRHSRTAEMARLLWLYENETQADGAQAAWCVYYSLLCGTNVSSAQTLAQRVYDREPNNPLHRVAYAFSLVRQQRFSEALNLIQKIDKPDLSGMQVSLIEASALLELGRKEEAKDALKKFVPAGAVPEEIKLAATLFRQAGLPNAEGAFTTLQ